MTTEDVDPTSLWPGDHRVTFETVREGRPDWKFACQHAPDDPRWIYRLRDGSPDPNGDGCWLESWWSGVGDELLDLQMDLRVGIGFSVKPSKDWDYDNGGRIVGAWEETQ